MLIRVTDLFLKDAFLAKAESLGLTISNDGETKNGIEHIQLGNSISVGTSDKFAINWSRNIDYYAGRGIVPVYDIQHDWAKITARLDAYAANTDMNSDYTEEVEEEDNSVYLESGDSVEVESGTVEFNGGRVDIADLAALKRLANAGVDVNIDSDDNTIRVNGVDVTESDIEVLEEMLSEEIV